MNSPSWYNVVLVATCDVCVSWWVCTMILVKLFGCVSYLWNQCGLVCGKIIDFWSVALVGIMMLCKGGGNKPKHQQHKMPWCYPGWWERSWSTVTGWGKTAAWSSLLCPQTTGLPVSDCGTRKWQSFWMYQEQRPWQAGNSSDIRWFRMLWWVKLSPSVQ